MMMKRSKVFIALALFGASASFWNCGGDSPPPVDPKDAQLAKLSQTWKATAVTYTSGGPATPVTGYENFTLTISGTAGQSTFDYTTSGRPSPPGTPTPWPASGNWEFGTDFSTVVIRTDIPLPVTYSLNAAGTILQLSFDYSCAACIPYSSRTSSVSGQWSFTFGL